MFIPSPRYQIPHSAEHCPSLLAALVDLYNACWSSSSVPEALKKGVVRLIPKGSAEENPGNFQPIALTSCIGKVFTTIVKNRWLSYLLQNDYGSDMDTIIQKAFCAWHAWLHQFKLATAIQEVCKKYRSLTICWLDLANAYGRVHHQLIQFAVRHYQACPISLSCSTVVNLNTNLSATITTRSWEPAEIPLQVGVYS